MLGNMQVNHTIYLNGDNLTIHENAIHNPSVTLASEIKQMYKCWDCTYLTNWSSNLRRHENFKHIPSEIKQMYKCRDCTYSTKRSTDLKRLEKAMHIPSVTEYQCTIDVAALKNEIVQLIMNIKRN